jgi:DNA-directed RNA polymerase subunit F
MIGKQLKEQKAVSLADVMEIMEKRKGDGELGFEQQTTYDYLKARTLIEPKKAAHLVKDLLDDGKLSLESAIKVADILPKSESQLSVVVSKERHTFTKAELGEILKIVEKYE